MPLPSADRALLITLALTGCGGAAPPMPTAIPAPAETARERIAGSTRHGEWVRIPAGGADTVRAWVVYPERSTRAPVVVVIHEIFGLTTWVRGVADQLAADGFIAVAPDLLTGKRMAMPPDSLWSAEGGLDSAVAMISALDYPEVLRRIEAAGLYGSRLPAAEERWGVLGFCWGGSMVLATAAHAGSLAAAVSFYGGGTPDEVDLSAVRAPTLALLAEDDAYWPVLESLVERAALRGPAIHDARIAALCLRHGVQELLTADRDFSRFPQLATRNPLI